MPSAAQLEKEQGNAAFKAGKLTVALGHYTKAMNLDPADVAFPLNRAMANLKLQRWSEAEKDASAALQLEPGNLKAHWRRCTARKELGDFTGARQDLWAYFHAGGDPQKLVEDNAKIARAEVDAMLVATHRSTSKFYEVKESPGKGLGAFATRSFQRGDLVFAEWPLYTIPRDKPDEGLFEVMIRIPPSAMREFLSLHDTGTLQPPPDDPLCQEALAATMIKIKSIQNGNILGVGNNKLALGLRFSRFNYSCAPNAAYSWHDEMGTIRVYALRTIEKGEEITCSANMRDALYGRAKKERNEHLKAHNFTCLCSACTLPRAEQVGSDRRRKELRRLFDTMIVHPAPVSEAWQSRIKLYEVVSALRFMEEEGLAGDTGDFTLVAARHCVFHSDWDSVKYWAAMTYESRASQYGADSPRALGLLEPDVINLLLSPRTNRLVGMGEVHLLTDIRL